MVTLPNSRRAAVSASCCVTPCSRSRSISRARCDSISCEKSSCFRLRQNMISPLDTVRAQHPPDGCRQPAPLAGFAMQLFASRFGQLIKPSLTVVFAGAPFSCDPAADLESLQRRVERAVVDQQHIIRLLLDSARDPLAMPAAQDQRAQDKEIKRSLEQRDAVGLFSGWHSTQVSARLGSNVNLNSVLEHV